MRDGADEKARGGLCKDVGVAHEEARKARGTHAPHGRVARLQGAEVAAEHEGGAAGREGNEGGALVVGEQLRQGVVLVRVRRRDARSNAARNDQGGADRVGQRQHLTRQGARRKEGIEHDLTRDERREQRLRRKRESRHAHSNV